jgi:hypothetical protein
MCLCLCLCMCLCLCLCTCTCTYGPTHHLIGSFPTLVLHPPYTHVRTHTRTYTACACARRHAKATVNPYAANIGVARNLADGVWRDTAATIDIIDPLTGDVMVVVPDTNSAELAPFESAAKRVLKSGMHNPIRSPEKYKFWGDISTDVARRMAEPETELFLAKLIQRVVPKSDKQALAEVHTTRKWFEWMGGDTVRMMAKSFGVPGDHAGQETRGYRFPYGNVAVVTPFNFPLEICALQSFSALMVGNRPMVKVDEKVSIVNEQFYRLMIDCGMPTDAADVRLSFVLEICLLNPIWPLLPSGMSGASSSCFGIPLFFFLLSRLWL